METELQTERMTSPEARCNGVVLIVDDEAQNRTLLRDTLEVHQYEIEEANDGLEALQKIAERPPDVILLDVMMPGMDGFEVCRRVKLDPETAPIPVLMVTALSERQERLMGVAAGANDFLNKPVDLQDLTLRVGNAVQLRKLYRQLEAERQKSDRLLLNVLPQPIAERLKRGESSIADYHPDITVLVADLTGFTNLSAHVDPAQVVTLLNEIFCGFDALVLEHGLETLKTIGDTYLAAGGLTVPLPDHAGAAARLALAMRDEIGRFNDGYGTSLRLRIGLSSGPVIAGVIGRNRFAYDVWGDTVNLASRLQSMGAPGSIHVSENSYEQLKQLYRFERVNMNDLKGGATLPAYRLSGAL